ncbi:MAG: PadR family transcriptional regulator [Planctomycetota bacterium]|nr:MAG: PadR family transcriptional regulator [Planctomycetota bacterium]
MADSKARTALLQGSLDLLILRTLAAGAQHGYAIAKHVYRASDEFLSVEEGSLYPALHRLERRGWVASEWGTSESNRRAKYYQLTPKGKKQLQVETDAWLEMSRAIDRVLNYRPAEA